MLLLVVVPFWKVGGDEIWSSVRLDSEALISLFPCSMLPFWAVKGLCLSVSDSEDLISPFLLAPKNPSVLSIL